MKKYIFIILFIHITTLSFSQNAMWHYLNYSLSFNTYNSQEYNLNHSVGTEFLFFYDKFINSYGLNYTFGDNIINIQYSFNLIHEPIVFTFLFLGLGINSSYNINNNFFGLSPQVSITLIPGLLLKFNLSYKYNINFNYTNSHEILFTIGINNLYWVALQAGV